MFSVLSGIEWCVPIVAASPTVEVGGSPGYLDPVSKAKDQRSYLTGNHFF